MVGDIASSSFEFEFRVRVSTVRVRVRVLVVGSPSKQIRAHNLLDYKILRQVEAEVRAV
jgi:hypothetical protein